MQGHEIVGDRVEFRRVEFERRHVAAGFQLIRIVNPRSQIVPVERDETGTDGVPAREMSEVRTEHSITQAINGMAVETGVLGKHPPARIDRRVDDRRLPLVIEPSLNSAGSSA